MSHARPAPPPRAARPRRWLRRLVRDDRLRQRLLLVVPRRRRGPRRCGPTSTMVTAGWVLPAGQARRVDGGYRRRRPLELRQRLHPRRRHRRRLHRRRTTTATSSLGPDGHACHPHRRRPGRSLRDPSTPGTPPASPAAAATTTPANSCSSPPSTRSPWPTRSGATARCTASPAPSPSSSTARPRPRPPRPRRAHRHHRHQDRHAADDPDPRAATRPDRARRRRSAVPRRPRLQLRRGRGDVARPVRRQDAQRQRARRHRHVPLPRRPLRPRRHPAAMQLAGTQAIFSSNPIDHSSATP